MAYLGIDLTTATTLEDYSPLPAGEYPVYVIDSAEIETRSGEKQLMFTYKVSSGDYTGRLVFDRLSLWSANPKALEFSQRKLKTIAQAVRMPGTRINDSSEFHGKQMIVRLDTREYDGKEYQDVRGYKPIATQQVPGAMPPQKAAPSSSAPKAKMPWE